MIILTEVATKLENILNSLEDMPYNFKVATEGLHIDSIANEEKNGNFIPVFISSMGGQYNPVKGLKQGTYSIQVVFYYPVRFKDDFYVICEDLIDTFVGSIINYGNVSGKAVSNISVPQYGEIQDIDFAQFTKWVDANYQRKVEVMEPYMTMQFNLYLTTAASGLLYGNDIKNTLSFTYNGNTYTLEDVDFDGASLQSNSQTQSEQEEETPESKSLPFGTAYGQSIKIYPNIETKARESTHSNPIYFYKELLKIWLSGNIQNLECDFTFQIANDSDLTYTRKCFIQSVVAPIEKGQLFALTLTFARSINDTTNDVEEEGDDNA